MIDEELVLRLKKDQNLLGEEEETLRQLKAEFDEKHKELIGNINNLKGYIAASKNAVTNMALEEFKETGNKKLLGGIGIREKTTISYDGREALAFAKRKDMFLTLDKKAFEKAAPSLGLDFVTVEKITQVTFPAVIKEVK